ncbi:MAG: DegT/DnrJ/EryC1/StrS family aminotransferase [Acidimicrobiia bacterium]|nr:DegT/DnrJ/EryC1/StrS family aminotransferase [Acidimicrobiia bacterium]
MGSIAPRAATDPLRLPSDQDSTGRSLGDEEVALLREVIESGVLTSTKGEKVRALEARFARDLGSAGAVACSSGTAAIHAAVAAIDPEPGDEIVTTSVTDMGALTPIIYQGAIPVFADVDPVSLNVTAQSVEAVLSDRTRAIVATHLFGHPCDLEGIGELARSRGVPLIEDCAQAYLASSGGTPVGTAGVVGCFSLQQGKHITTGEGGMVVTSSVELAGRMRRFVNKAWDYEAETTDHDFIALNYRLTELQGAVALAQIEKLAAGVATRISNAGRLSAALSRLPGISVPAPPPGDVHSYWRYAVHVDSAVIPGGPGALAAELRLHGIASAPRYIQKPAFRCGLFVNQQTFGKSRWPFTLARPEAVDYDASRFPGTFEALERILVLPWNERYSESDVDRLGEAIASAVARLAGPGAGA